MGVKTKTREFLLNLLTNRQVQKDFERWEELYGKFDQNNYDEFYLTDLPSESAYYHGEIIKWALDLKPKAILFAGENNETAIRLKESMHAESVYTAGLTDTDFQWNFEKDAPLLEKKFDLIVSQAILEHLLNPYKHVKDLSNLLQDNGCLILHTVLPGFCYHRHPIDALRFFPDWFEEVGQRIGMEVVRKRIVEAHIFYMYRKNKIINVGSK
ncbi:MAG: class I SAM-dependent methyltransferase [Desulfocapsa sp.]|nr:class I SAM-dependent methyltransferase [Desulfocapsa sp.]